MSWKEYEIDDNAIDEWLPWGGLLRDGVMKNKDGSFFSVIQYEPCLYSGKKCINRINFKSGWSLWSEKQQQKGVGKCFLVVSWNPEYDKSDMAINALYGQMVSRNDAIVLFEKDISRLFEEFFGAMICKILEGQELLDYLTFSLSIGSHSVIMPETPLFFDALLSQDLDVNFLENSILINQKKMMIFSLPGISEMPIMNILYKAFAKFSYRYVQRLLIFNEKEAKEDLEKYTSKWCGGRKSIKNFILTDLLSDLNGYYNASFIFLIDENEYEEFMKYCYEVLNVLEIPYLFEEYNMKDVWWGSLPGLFRANITAPIIGFSSLDDLLIQQDYLKNII